MPAGSGGLEQPGGDGPVASVASTHDPSHVRLDGLQASDGTPEASAAVLARPWTPPSVVSAAKASPERPVVPRSGATSSLARFRRIAFRAISYAVLAIVIWYLAMAALILVFRYADPPMSALMLLRAAEGQGVDRTVVGLDQIAPTLRRAVVVSEDGKFCTHRGFDFGEIRAAFVAGENFGRGASTITQQLAKNLFLWPGRSYVRKILEVPLTITIEAMWPKWRIFEVYLNVVEWGPGLYGAEGAAQRYFGKPAARLTEREAALLAVALPNPLARDASDPEPMQARLASRLQSRMRLRTAFPCVFPDQPAKR